jgi:signal transduction histidine kinase
MSWLAFPLHSTRVADFRDATQAALAVFFAYLLGAEAAFVVGTLSDKIFAPFWPPNIVLFCALLILPRERWWLVIAAAFPAHVIAETRVGMPVHQLMVAFATNIAVALAASEIIRRLEFAWFRTSKSAAAYIVLIGFLCPAIVALGGAFVPIAGGGASQRYLEFWLQWTASNALGFLTLGPAVLLFAEGGVKALWPANHRERFEFVTMLVLLALVAWVALPTAAVQSSNPFIIALLYAPVPLIIWCAVRFGAAGAGASVMTVAVVFVADEISGPNLFIAATAENNVLALQALLTFLSVPVLLLGASIDEIRQLERQVSADEAELDKQGRELTHLMRVSQLGELSGGLAHELTQPLTAILANAQAARIMLTSDPSNVTVLISVLDDIIREDQRAGEVIKRLRSLLRKEDSALEDINVGDLCNSVLSLLHAEAIGRRMAIKFVAGSDVPHIVGDHIQLQQVILNLVMNAMEAEQRNRSSKHVVVLQSRRIGDSIEISVADDGTGVSPLHSARLFEPFFTTKERGLGLGLSICSAIVRRHGGTLALENNVTGGATAYLCLPVYPKGVAS